MRELRRKPCEKEPSFNHRWKWVELGGTCGFCFEVGPDKPQVSVLSVCQLGQPILMGPMFDDSHMTVGPK